MKFKIVESLEEKFTSEKDRDIHYNKHIVRNKEYEMSPEEYEQAAEDLARKKIDNKTIFGYIQEVDGKQRYAKYDKDLELFTSYVWEDDEPKTVTAFRRDWRTFNGLRFSDYIDEIPEGK